MSLATKVRPGFRIAQDRFPKLPASNGASPGGTEPGTHQGDRRMKRTMGGTRRGRLVLVAAFGLAAIAGTARAAEFGSVTSLAAGTHALVKIGEFAAPTN